MLHLIDVALGTGSDMLLELVATTEANESSASVWRKREGLPENWFAWEPLGKPGRGDPLSVSVIQQRSDGRLEAFVIDSEDSAVWHSWQTDPKEGWSDWDLLGNPGGRHAGGVVALTFLPDGRVMAVVTAGGTVWRLAHTSRGQVRFGPRGPPLAGRVARPRWLSPRHPWPTTGWKWLR
jgi:hypothetical protein